MIRVGAGSKFTRHRTIKSFSDLQWESSDNILPFFQHLQIRNFLQANQSKMYIIQPITKSECILDLPGKQKQLVPMVYALKENLENKSKFYQVCFADQWTPPTAQVPNAINLNVVQLAHDDPLQTNK